MAVTASAPETAANNGEVLPAATAPTPKVSKPPAKAASAHKKQSSP
jgi:hypothetical protein